MMNNKYLLLFILFGLMSCKKENNKAEAEKVVAEWVGKTISFPLDIQCNCMGKDTICPNINTPYKVLVYIDSTGCTSCKLQLYKWNSFIKETDSIMSGKVSFLFYFQPKNEKELTFLLRRDRFEQSVYIDNENKLNTANKFPDNIIYQCFLLDKDNRVLLVGNPTVNPEIWDLYKQIITGDESLKLKDIAHTTVEIEQTEIELTETKTQETSIATFILKNTGNYPLLIKDMSASCGCTVPEWDKKPIKPGDRTEIKVKITPDNSGYFRKTVTVFCNTQEGSVQLAVKSMVKD